MNLYDFIIRSQADYIGELTTSLMLHLEYIRDLEKEIFDLKHPILTGGDVDNMPIGQVIRIDAINNGDAFIGDFEHINGESFEVIGGGWLKPLTPKAIKFFSDPKESSNGNAYFLDGFTYQIIK